MGGDPKRETLTLIPTLSGQTLYISPSGNYWRAYDFIEGAQTYEVVEKPEHVYNAAWAFGHFQCLLNDFPVTDLHETIPDFHHTPKRFEAFCEAVNHDVMNRAAGVQNEIDFAMARSCGDTTPGRYACPGETTLTGNA